MTRWQICLWRQANVYRNPDRQIYIMTERQTEREAERSDRYSRGGNQAAIQTCEGRQMQHRKPGRHEKQTDIQIDIQTWQAARETCRGGSRQPYKWRQADVSWKQGMQTGRTSWRTVWQTEMAGWQTAKADVHRKPGTQTDKHTYWQTDLWTQTDIQRKPGTQAQTEVQPRGKKRALKAHSVLAIVNGPSQPQSMPHTYKEPDTRGDSQTASRTTASSDHHRNSRPPQPSSSYWLQVPQLDNMDYLGGKRETDRHRTRFYQLLSHSQTDWPPDRTVMNYRNKHMHTKHIHKPKHNIQRILISRHWQPIHPFTHTCMYTVCIL